MARRAVRPAAVAYERAPEPRGATPWRRAPWCAVDLELTGLDAGRDEIVSFAAIPILEGRVHLAGAVSGLVRPGRAVPASSIRIHGLRDADLAAAAPLEEAIDPLLAAMTGRVLVAHVAAVERAFLGPALRRLGVRLRSAVADTSVLGRLWLWERDGRRPADMSLSDLARALGLPVHAEHDALGDALTTAQVFIAAATHLDARDTETVRTLTRADGRLAAMRAFHA